MRRNTVLIYSHGRRYVHVIIAGILLLFAACENPIVKKATNHLFGSDTSTPPQPPIPATFTVNFNSNGGTPTPSVQNVALGSYASSPPAVTKTGYSCIFDGWYNNPGFSGTQFNFVTTQITSNITLYAKWRPYELGETGPGGGFIFYRSEVGFTVDGYPAYTAWYLEAAPIDIGTTLIWASVGYYLSDISGTAEEIGSGRKNTTLILGADAAAPVAIACIAPYNAGGSMTDWFLPSRDEFYQLYLQWNSEGRPSSYNLSTTISYWSSSQSIPSSAYTQDFMYGQQNSASKNSSRNVRPIRAF